jgi:sialate O-acetylesterase
MTRKIVFASLLAFTAALCAEVKLPAIISNGMVLQQGTELPIWGWAEAGETVTVSFSGQSATAAAGADGRWSVTLKPLAASAQPAVLTVKGAGTTVTIEDVLVGEVWFCSGQSNMEWGMNRIANAEEEIKKADNPLIRHFKAPRKHSPAPQTDVAAAWVKTAPDTIAGHSAVAYMFGRRLHAALDNVPVGLVNSSWGGTRIEPWTPICGFRDIPALDEIRRTVETADPHSELHREVLNRYIGELSTWISTAQQLAEARKPLTPAPEFPKNLVFDSGGRNAHQQPTVLYNGMVAGVVPYAVKGAIWYQGESNRGEGMLYLEKTRALVSGWRKVWNRPDLPYYLVQLAPFKYGGDEYALPEIWEAQAAVPKTIPNTGYAVINDIATLNDIHPPNKQDVGLRLANQALNRTYGRSEIEWSGPMYRSYTIEGDKIRIAFDHAKGLKTRDGKAPDWFEICGADGKFVKAAAVIDGETVLISSPALTQPTGFRFAWHQLAEPNLVNHIGLPTGAFRDGKALEIDGAKAMKELEGFRLLCEIDIEATPRYGDKPPAYTTDNRKTAGEFSRVAYLLQLQSPGGGIEYVMTAMDAFTGDAAQLGIPHRAAGTALQKRVANLTVRSNVKGVPELTGDDGGCIEFGSLNYGTQCAQKLPGGDGGKYDFDDTLAADGSYGCMQVHSWKARTTLFAVNNFNGGPVDIGIGNNAKGEHPDYTFMRNGGNYTLRRLTVYVK